MDVNRISDMLITAKQLFDTININIVLAYAPQGGCTYEDNEEFWEELEEVIRSFSEKDTIIMAWWFWAWRKEPGRGRYTRVYTSI